MKEWEIEVVKLSDESLLHIANEFTSGKESKQSLKSAYRMMHSTIRTQIFFVSLYDIPQYVAYHFRTHFSLFPMAPEEYGWMFSKRTDKGGADFREVCHNIVLKMSEAEHNYVHGESNPAHLQLAMNDACVEICGLPDKYDRYAPTNFGFLVSAEGLMTMASKRLCVGSVSKETREVMEGICEEVKEVDPALYPYLVKPCIATGVCREKCCGFIRSEMFRKLRTEYKKLFTWESQK